MPPSASFTEDVAGVAPRMLLPLSGVFEDPAIASRFMHFLCLAYQH